MTRNLIIFKLVVLSSLLTIQSAFSQNYNLFDVLEEGKKNYPLLQAKEAQINSIEKKVKSSKTEYLPALSVGHQYTYGTSNNVEGSYLSNRGTAFAPSGGVRAENIYEPSFGSFTSTVLDWPIITFGRIRANVEAAKKENEIASSDYENELFQHQVKITNAYLMLLVSKRLTEVQRVNLARAEAFLNSSRALTNSGLRAGVDSSLARTEYIKAKLLLLESEKNEQAYNYQLQELLGEFKDTIIIDSMKFFTELPTPVNVSETDILQAPSLLLSKANTSHSIARSTAIRRSVFPTISAVGAAWARGSGISNTDSSYRTDFLSGAKYQVYNYLFGLTFHWNITNSYRFRYDYQSERYQVQKFEALYKHRLLLQTRELKEADNHFRLSFEQAKLAPTQLNVAEQAFRQSMARYESGLTDLPTFTQSLVALSRAEADYYVAYSSAWRALLMKAAAAGDLSIFLSQIR